MPVKSAITSSPRITTVTRDLERIGVTPSSSTCMLRARTPRRAARRSRRAGAARSSPSARRWRRSITVDRVVALDQLAHPPLADVQRADHGVEVAPGVARRAVVGEDDPPDVCSLYSPRSISFTGGRRRPSWYTSVASEAKLPGRLAADLGDVADVAGEADELVAEEDRPHHHVLGQVAAAAVGVVVDDDVPGLGRTRSPTPRPPIAPCAGSRPSSTGCSSSRRSGRPRGRAAPS